MNLIKNFIKIKQFTIIAFNAHLVANEELELPHIYLDKYTSLYLYLYTNVYIYILYLYTYICI